MGQCPPSVRAAMSRRRFMELAHRRKTFADGTQGIGDSLREDMALPSSIRRRTRNSCQLELPALRRYHMDKVYFIYENPKPQIVPNMPGLSRLSFYSRFQSSTTTHNSDLCNPSAHKARMAR